MTDEALLTAWAAGDEDAGAQLCRRHFDALHRFFRTKVPDATDDLVQITLLECMRSKDRYRGDSSFLGFLFGVARNCLLHHFRSRGRDRLDFDASRISVADLDPRPSTIVERDAERARVAEAMRHIPLDLQIVLELHYWEGLPTRDLAAALEVPQGTIKSRLRRGREALREVLGTEVIAAG